MRAPDAVMEPGMADVVARYMRAGGKPADVIESLMAGYEGERCVWGGAWSVWGRERWEGRVNGWVAPSQVPLHPLGCLCARDRSINWLVGCSIHENQTPKQATLRWPASCAAGWPWWTPPTCRPGPSGPAAPAAAGARLTRGPWSGWRRPSEGRPLLASAPRAFSSKRAATAAARQGCPATVAVRREAPASAALRPARLRPRRVPFPARLLAVPGRRRLRRLLPLLRLLLRPPPSRLRTSSRCWRSWRASGSTPRRCSRCSAPDAPGGFTS